MRFTFGGTGGGHWSVSLRDGSSHATREWAAMKVNRELLGRLLLFASLVNTGACRDPGGAAADTDTETDTETDPGTSTGTDTDTDTETDTEEEPEPITTELTIDVTFGSEMMMTITNSLHVWVLRPDGAAVTCNDLVSDLVDPYDLQLLRLADHVSTSPGDPVVIPAVEVGEGLVYIEGVTVAGAAELAGCQDATLVEPSTELEVVLGLAGTFDCSDAATEDGAPCDDGMFCTVGETCENGDCNGGGVRDCSVLADQCNAASCNEADGCLIEPVPNDTRCVDGLACTLGDSCQDGGCVGLPRDCDADAPLCQVSTGCVEPTGECVFIDADEELSCDDDAFCTVDTVCVSGSCLGNEMECAGDECNLPMCDEDGDECVTTFADDTTVCTNADNECAEPMGLCDGAGACVVDPANEGLPCDDEGTAGICENGACV